MEIDNLLEVKLGDKFKNTYTILGGAPGNRHGEIYTVGFDDKECAFRLGSYLKRPSFDELVEVIRNCVDVGYLEPCSNDCEVADDYNLLPIHNGDLVEYSTYLYPDVRVGEVVLISKIVDNSVKLEGKYLLRVRPRMNISVDEYITEKDIKKVFRDTGWGEE